MTLVDILREEASSEHVAYTEFALKLRGNETNLFCFFEGKDDHKYYGIRIANVCQREYQHIDCGGKGKVLALKKLIDQRSEYETIDTAYFVDSDYDHKETTLGVYCLPTYSIENQYCTKESISKILGNEFSLKETEEDHKLAIVIFEKLQAKFHDDTLLLNSWLACQNDNKKQSGVETFLYIDSTIGGYFDNIVLINLEGIRDFADLNHIATIESMFPNASDVSTQQLNEKIELFKTLTKVKVFRGKFELKFFTSCLDRLQKELGKRASTIFSKKHKCSIRFENASALTSLSIYATTPSCLLKYLNAFKGAYQAA